MALQLTAHATQDWLHATFQCAKNGWPPNSPDYHVWGAMPKAYHKPDIASWTSKPSTFEELQTRLEMIWNNLPQKPVAWAVLQACVFKAGGHFEHSL